MKAHKFKIADSDIDYKTYEYSFSGRMTKLRWKLLDRYVRKHNLRTHCHHEYDCCGCVSSTYMDIDYGKNLVKLTYTINFNY